MVHAIDMATRVTIAKIATEQTVQSGKQVPEQLQIQSPENPKMRVGELLVREDALYVTGEEGKVEVEWLLDTGCSLSLISVDQ